MQALKEGPEYVETFVQTVIANRPDLSAEKLRIATQGTLNAVKWAVNYKPAGKYKGNINLIRAEVSGRYPEVTEDYGLGEVRIQMSHVIHVIIIIKINNNNNNLALFREGNIFGTNASLTYGPQLQCHEKTCLRRCATCKIQTAVLLQKLP